jgi:dCTP diphosphatase
MSELDAVLSELRAFVREREWEPFHDPKNLAMAVASEAGELAAELRWVAGTEADAWCTVPENRERLGDEIADVLVTTLMLADRVGLDPIAVIRAKMEKNRAKYPVDRARGRSSL